MKDPEPEWGILPSLNYPGMVDLCAVWNDKTWVRMPISLEIISDFMESAPGMLHDYMQQITDDMERMHQENQFE